MLFCISYNANSINYQLLEHDADTFNNVIWSKLHVTPKLIYERLTFLEDEDEELIEKYTQEGLFEKLYQEKCQKIDNEKFREFSNQCKFIYEDYNIIDPLIQAAVHMLYECTAQKVENFYDYLSEKRVSRDKSIKEDLQKNDRGNNFIDSSRLT